MSAENEPLEPLQLEKYTSRKVREALGREGETADSLLAWQRSLVSRGLAPSTVNNHLASLSAFTTWVHAQDQRLFPAGDPAKGIGELGLPLGDRATVDDRALRRLVSDW